MAHLELDHIVQRHGRTTVVDGVSFRVDSGDIACLLGPSGCGKTTLLRGIAGFEELVAGEIRLRNRLVSRHGWRLAPEKRQIGMVFQDYALFPHLTVAGNVGFGLSALPAGERRQRITEWLSTVGLPDQGDKYPHQLSGGQQQRVALARALAPRPQLVLLDEPFSNLDIDLRERLALEVREILKRQGITAVLVTHDQHEAFAMADWIGVMTDGIIQQWDTPYRIYHQPNNRQVADFIGQGVFLPGVLGADGRVEIELGVLSARPLPENPSTDDRNERQRSVTVLLRPDDIIHDDRSPLRAEVRHKAFRGAEILYTLRLASGREVLSLVPSHHDHAIGERIGIRTDIDHVVAFPDHRAVPSAEHAPQVPRS
ncbi:MAG TPA: ABC transporter ATP-binding protein [Accumulibacter sp.]|nr:ABC transporter ATP-binding protein [Accumulibacter sp.]HMW16767.1 ABC transporter ATP-binding protein [Accumulibacter sp.]HMY06824.1 ABC transporter ATP-binding protein [Accumulibacter sp.]HNC17876.1 ABC transporter ATP-binding protein [Accumulibacter sp.]HND80715.1 ABC transporter ATP-binding protein [Accumulibacter sp.]